MTDETDVFAERLKRGTPAPAPAAREAALAAALHAFDPPRRSSRIPFWRRFRAQPRLLWAGVPALAALALIGVWPPAQQTGLTPGARGLSEVATLSSLPRPEMAEDAGAAVSRIASDQRRPDRPPHTPSLAAAPGATAKLGPPPARKDPGASSAGTRSAGAAPLALGASDTPSPEADTAQEAPARTRPPNPEQGQRAQSAPAVPDAVGHRALKGVAAARDPGDRAQNPAGPTARATPRSATLPPAAAPRATGPGGDRAETTVAPVPTRPQPDPAAILALLPPSAIPPPPAEITWPAPWGGQIGLSVRSDTAPWPAAPILTSARLGGARVFLSHITLPADGTNRAASLDPETMALLTALAGVLMAEPKLADIHPLLAAGPETPAWTRLRALAADRAAQGR